MANDAKPRPLTAHAISVLRSLRSGPTPCQEINPGVIHRFRAEALVDLVPLRSPYAVHKGGDTMHARINAAGLARLDELDAAPPAPKCR